MQRRKFLHTSAAAAGLAAATRESLAALADGPTKRVGLIGSGWYGKIDLLRLVQVALWRLFRCVTWTRRCFPLLLTW